MPDAPVSNINYNTCPITVGIADSKLLHSSTTATIDLLHLPPGTTSGTIMPAFANNLPSMGVFCYAGCTVVFTKEDVTVNSSAGIKIMHGWRESNCACMWRFNLTNATAVSTNQLTPMVLPNIILDDKDDNNEDYNIISAPTISQLSQLQSISKTENGACLLSPPHIPPIVTPPIVNNSTPNSTPTCSMSYQCRAYNLPSVRALVEYHHAMMGWPTKAGLLKATKQGHLRSFPGLTLSAATRYCPDAATPTVMGHTTQV